MCLRRDESRYYVLAHNELAGLAQAQVRDLTASDLFALLESHGNTEAETVPVGTEPDRRAVALDENKSPAGIWIEGETAGGLEGAMAGGELALGEGAPPPGDLELGAEPEPVAANGGGEVHAANGGGADDRRGGGDDVKDSFFRRTPHMDLSTDEPLELGQEVQALVYLDTLAARPGETVREVMIELPEDLDTLDIEVMLAATDHFEIAGESFKTLTVQRDEERSENVPFDLRVRDDAPLDQPAALTAHLTYHHRPAGRVHRAVAVAGAADPAVVEDETAPVAPEELAIDANALPADLTVDIVRTPENDGRKFLVTLRTTLVDDFAMTEPEPWNFRDETDEIVGGMMSQFTLKGASPADRKASLEGAGIVLWEEAAPKCFRDLFWRLIDEGKTPRTIYIASEEPHIPWELMRPRRDRPSGPPEQRDALGVEFAVGRYVGPGHRSPKQNDSIEDSYVVAPTKYIRYKQLAKAADEGQWVAERFGGTIVTPAERARLDELLSEKPVGLLHFIAHGTSDPKAPQLLVLDNDALFNAMQVRAMDGLGTACATKAPLVFLNACEVGRATPSLVGAGGFASEFIKAGARCVIAPIWSVKDSLAHEVAVTFYQAALDQPQRPFADILRDIRAKSYAEGGGEDTYAAYCFYGDPLTSLQPPD